MVVNITKISQKMKKINWFRTEKNIDEKKHFIIIIRKYFNLENCVLYKGKYKKPFSFALTFEKKYKKFFIFQILQVLS